MTSCSARLWSLWDMLVRDAPAFMRVVSLCDRLDSMTRIGGVVTLGLFTRRSLSISTKDLSKDHLNALLIALDGMGLKATMAAVRDTLAALEEPKVSRGELGRMYRDIFKRFHDEMAGRYALFQDDSEAVRLLSDDPPFGDTVEFAFPTAAEDIDEASKCLALGRPTAAVFHLMRAMECAVQALCKELKIENCDREWGKLLSDMEAKIKLMPRGDKRDTWSESHSHLYHVKQAWRNRTMHPKKTYTEEEAEGVFSAVRIFMRHLARLLPASAAL